MKASSMRPGCTYLFPCIDDTPAGEVLVHEVTVESGEVIVTGVWNFRTLLDHDDTNGTGAFDENERVTQVIR